MNIPKYLGVCSVSGCSNIMFVSERKSGSYYVSELSVILFPYLIPLLSLFIFGLPAIYNRSVTSLK